MIKFFKKRKTIEDAVLIFLDDLIEEAEYNFSELKQNFIVLNTEMIISDEQAKWNFSYARIALEMVKLNKYYSKSEINEIVIYIFWILENDKGEHSKNQVEKYYNAFTKGIRNDQNSAFDDLSIILLKDLLGEDFNKFSVNLAVTAVLSPILIQIATTKLIACKVNCKQLKENYNLVFNFQNYNKK